MMKLNFGCGSRFSTDWVNIDVYSSGPGVRRVNLLKRFPYPDNYFDAAYSSHVLEHFTPSQADHLISEAFRVLKPGGLLRTVVPDLEATCREYLRILDLSEPSNIRKEYDWIITELLDQLTRSTPSGEMLSYFQRLRKLKDAELWNYVESRFGSISAELQAPQGLTEKLRSISVQKVYNRLFYVYLGFVSHLFPQHIRSQVMVLTGLGERHRWMYDRIGLSQLLRKHGFHDVTVQQPKTSAIPRFNDDGLDMEPNAKPYKRLSLYIEAAKPRKDPRPAVEFI